MNFLICKLMEGYIPTRMLSPETFADTTALCCCCVFVVAAADMCVVAVDRLPYERCRAPFFVWLVMAGRQKLSIFWIYLLTRAEFFLSPVCPPVSSDNRADGLIIKLT